MSCNVEKIELSMAIEKANTGADAIKRAPIVEDNTGLRCLRIGDISNNRPIEEWGYTSANEDVKNKFSLKKDDVIVARTGNTIGVVKYINKNLNSVYNNGLIRLKINSDYNAKYIYYNLISDDFKNFIYGISAGTSTQPNMKIEHMLRYKISNFSLEEQKKIIDILSVLDEKIVLNNEMNKTLEEMAQTLFKRWFVNFEFPCIPENYKFSGAGKPYIPENYKFFGADKLNKPADFDKVCTYKRVGGLPIPDGKSWFAYVLLCDDGSFYKGMTNDLYRRFYEHYTGNGAEWTKTHKPVKVIHYEKFATQEEARKREEELKSGFGREWIKREYQKHLEDEENMQEAIIEKAGLPAREYTRKSKFMIAGEMVGSELGMIPKEWNVYSIADVCDINSSNYSPKEQWSYINYLDTANITKNKIGTIQNIDCNNEKVPSRAKRKVKRDSIVYSTVRPNQLHYGIIKEKVQNMIVSTGFVVLDSKLNYIKSDIIYYWLIQDKNTELLQSIGETSTSTYPSIKPSDIGNMKLVLPSKKCIENLADKFDKINKLIEELKVEEKQLIEIRDLLLPKLVSGEIDVNSTYVEL